MSQAPRAYGVAPATGAIRTEPEDFLVEEHLDLEPDGAGEHLLMLVEKRSANTHWVARTLADFAGVSRNDVGYAGAKDRHAVARQWFSLPLGSRPDPDWTRLDAPGVQRDRASGRVITVKASGEPGLDVVRGQRGGGEGRGT